MSKSPEMEKVLEKLATSMFGRSRIASMSDKICVTCGLSVGEFRDALSQKEYGISGMCQACQDSVFGVDDEE